MHLLLIGRLTGGWLIWDGLTNFSGEWLADIWTDRVAESCVSPHLAGWPRLIHTMMITRTPQSGKWLSLNVQMIFKSLFVPQFANNLLAKAIHIAHPYSWIKEIESVSSLEKWRIVILSIYYILKIFSMTTVHCLLSNIFSTQGIHKGRNGTCLISTFLRMHLIE